MKGYDPRRHRPTPERAEFRRRVRELCRQSAEELAAVAIDPDRSPSERADAVAVLLAAGFGVCSTRSSTYESANDSGSGT